MLQITIHSASDEFPELRLTTFGTRQIFTDLREVWLIFSPCNILLMFYTACIVRIHCECLSASSEKYVFHRHGLKPRSGQLWVTTISTIQEAIISHFVDAAEVIKQDLPVSMNLGPREDMACYCCNPGEG